MIDLLVKIGLNLQGNEGEEVVFANFKKLIREINFTFIQADKEVKRNPKIRIHIERIVKYIEQTPLQSLLLFLKHGYSNKKQTILHLYILKTVS